MLQPWVRVPFKPHTCTRLLELDETCGQTAFAFVNCELRRYRFKCILLPSLLRTCKTECAPFSTHTWTRLLVFDKTFAQPFFFGSALLQG